MDNLADLQMYPITHCRCCCRGEGPPSKSSDSCAVCGHGSFLLLSCFAVAFGVAWYGLAAAELGGDVETELVKLLKKNLLQAASLA